MNWKTGTVKPWLWLLWSLLGSWFLSFILVEFVLGIAEPDLWDVTILAAIFFGLVCVVRITAVAVKHGRKE